jgi:uncharacterized membrane protein YoaK (UPF0700 family)
MIETHSDLIAAPIGHVPETRFNSLTVAMLLTASGGFLDAFSYFGHGHVFANVMTANVVLSAVSCVHGDWPRAAQLLLPVASYVAGALTGSILKSWVQKWATVNPQALAIGIGIAVLTGIGWLPAGFSGAAIVSIISFGIAIRSCFFSHVEAWSYASTMPTGNLRQLGESIFQSLSQAGNPKSKRQVMVFGFISLSFFLGALAGGVATDILHNRAVWVGALFLVAALVCGLSVRPSAVSSVRSSICVIAILALFSSRSARAQTEPNVQEQRSACARPAPAFPLLTYDEDNLYFSDPGCRTELLDRLKFIPLRRGENEDSYLSFGVSTRDRGEYNSNPNWSDKPSGNAYLMQRYFLHMDLHAGERFRFFGELASSLENGRNGGPRTGLDEEQLYVHQGFFDLGLWRSGQDSLGLRAGREELAFGSEFLVSTRDGRNIRTSFDGLRLTWLSRDWTVDAFAVRPSLTIPGMFTNSPDHTQSFWGAYAVHPFRFLPHGKVDLYYMGLDNKAVPFNGKGIGREQRETIGTRLSGTTGQWDYNDESTFQWGWFGSNDIRAWAVSTEHGCRLDSVPLAPRFALRAAAMSGNQNPSSNTLGTFDSIHEQGPYYTYAELFARRNLVAVQPSAELKLSKTVALTINPAFYWRESTRDGLYSIGNTVVVSGLNSNARYIATQASARLQWRMTRNLSWFTEYAHFFPGEFISQATPGKNINFWTGWLDIRY